MTTKTEFKDNTRKVQKDIQDSVGVGLTEIAIQLEGEVALRCPVDTGHLRGSISYIAPYGSGRYGRESCYRGKRGTRIRKGRKIPGKCCEDEHPGTLQGTTDKRTAYVGTNVEYAAYVEYGTKHMKAQPYMRTGLAAAIPAMKEIFRRRMVADE